MPLSVKEQLQMVLGEEASRLLSTDDVIIVGDENYTGIRINVVKVIAEWGDADEVTDFLFEELRKINDLRQVYDYLSGIDELPNGLKVTEFSHEKTVYNPYHLNGLLLYTLETEGPIYVVAYIHMGGDVRWNYAGPIVFKFNDDMHMDSFITEVTRVTFAGCNHVKPFVIYVPFTGDTAEFYIETEAGVFESVWDGVEKSKKYSLALHEVVGLTGIDTPDVILDIIGVVDGEAFCRLCGAKVHAFLG